MFYIEYKCHKNLPGLHPYLNVTILRQFPQLLLINLADTSDLEFVTARIAQNKDKQTKKFLAKIMTEKKLSTRSSEFQLRWIAKHKSMSLIFVEMPSVSFKLDHVSKFYIKQDLMKPLRLVIASKQTTSNTRVSMHLQDLEISLMGIRS